MIGRGCGLRGEPRLVVRPEVTGHFPRREREQAGDCSQSDRCLVLSSPLEMDLHILSPFPRWGKEERFLGARIGCRGN